MTALPDSTEHTLPEDALPDHDPVYWSESIRQKPRVDRFPWLALLLSLLPGVIAILLLLFPLIWLLDQAQRDIVFVGHNGQVSAIRANLNDQRLVSPQPLQLDRQTQLALSGVSPVLGLSQWSPDGLHLATTVISNGRSLPSIYSITSSTARVIAPAITNANHFLVPGDGWSPDGLRLAVLEIDRQRPFLALLDISQPTPIITHVTSLLLDTRAGLDWHPVSGELLVTVLPDDTVTSTLQIISLDGQARAFAPSNRLLADAVWSPAGESIAYVVVNTELSQQNNLVVGDIWIARSDGFGAQQLASGGLNTTPVWPEADPAHIYFTRLVTTSHSYDLYRVNRFGQSQPEKIGESSATLSRYPFDRKHFISWSEDEATIKVSSESQSVISPLNWTMDTAIRSMIRSAVPVWGVPIWSPNGRFLATTQWQNGKILPVLYNANLEQIPAPIPDSAVIAVPADGWAADSSALALVRHDGERPLLTLLSGADFIPTKPFTFTLDSRAGISWSPTAPRLLVTIYTENAPTPSLLIVDSGGGQQVFNPNDNRLVHADGAWSPDSSQIAYIAADTYTTTQNILAGELWLADATGSNARPLVTEAQVIAPVWNPTGEMIYFTRFNGPAGPFALYRVAADGSAPPEYVGPGSEAILLYPFDRTLLLQWSSDSQQLMFVGQHAIVSDQYITAAPDNAAIATIQTGLPVLGNGRWSPNNTQFAGTVLDPADGAVRTAIFRSPSDPPIFSPTTSDWIVMPGDGWSPDGRYLALLRYDGANTNLAVMDTSQIAIGMAPFSLDIRAGFHWHPTNAHIMATEWVEGITPTLQIYHVSDGSISTFAPNDSQEVHADGVWSPDGRSVAYIAHDNITDTLTMDFLAGALWVANSNGERPRQLVAEGLNFAPIWSANQSHILFTRHVTETDTFAQYRVDLNGGDMEYLGTSTELFARFPFDRSAFLRWSPDGRRWLLPGADQSMPYLYFTQSNEATVSPLPVNCNATTPHVVRWAPTNRGVLATCPTGQMVLHWTDRERDDKVFPNGLYPAWQP